MTNRETMELFIEKNGQETVAYPFVEKDHVVFGNGMGIEEVIEQDISMPTVTHEEVSFKVGVGDQDVSSSVVDSSVGEMVIKGQTYHNILPEPSTHVLTNNKEMFKVNEGLDPNVEIVDAVSKSAILSGQTLVNQSTTSELTFENAWQGKIIGGNALQSGKKYFTSFDLESDNSELTIQARNGNSFVYHIRKGFTKGKNVLSFILEQDANGLRFQVGSDFNVKISNIIILEYQEGMENWDIPYFTGMQSVKLPVLKATGKNLADITKLKTVLEEKPKITEIGDNEYKIVTNGIWDNHGVCWRVKLKAGETIYFKTAVKGISNVRLYDGTGNTYLQKGYTSTDINIYEDAILSYTASQDMVVMCRYWINDNWIGYIKSPYIAINNSDYEPFKSNILTTSEEVELRGIGDVKDELDLLTGELTQRIGEIVLDGMEEWNVSGHSNWTSCYTRKYILPHLINKGTSLVSDKMMSYIYYDYLGNNDVIGISITNQGYICFKYLPNGSKPQPSEVSDYLKSNPITIQYPLETESIKTVDLSTSGNWEKVVLDGSENWSVAPDTSNNNAFFRGSNTVPNNVKVNSNNLAQKVICDILTPFTQDQICNKPNNIYGISLGWNDSNLCVRHKDFPLTNEGLTQWKQYLSQNPITVWYQTATHQDSTQVKQPIFFKDGHIQLSSGADNSLIPTLNYQAKTSNSYVMDLMKTNTKYTMKAKSASGTFTIDGASYGAGTNGTFTTPTSMTNKLLVMSNNANEEVMIIEGDVTSKTIPYFKGIKSAFEGEDKIEVLSTSKNLLSPELYVKDNVANGVVVTVKDGVFTLNGTVTNYHDLALTPNNGKINLKLEKGKRYRVSLNHIKGSTNYSRGIAVKLTLDDGTIKWLGSDINASHLTMNGKISWIRMTPYEQDTFNDYTFTLQVEESPVSTLHEPYKSNSTKIPLLSPLRSLPNGVCDELIIDRMKKKATLIQRVGHSVINSEFAKNGGKWGSTKDTDPCWGFHCGNYVQGSFKLNEHNSINDKLPIKPMATTGDPLMGYYQSNPHIALRREEVCDMKMALNWLDRNPIDFYYQLETPVITEVDLEGFPYIYKDGHIFLNSEIAPNTQITYSISQQHQISASTQDLIRHEQELVYLYKLIAQYIQVDYQSTLLSLDLKLK